MQIRLLNNLYFSHKMSDSERKKRSQCIDVWEEAGSEFYQESYPGMEADLEAFQKNPNKLSTLLPSNKTRTGIVD